MSTATPETLLEFYETVYRPMRMADSAAASCQQYHVTISRVEKFLKRPPLVSDLTESTLAQFMAHERARGMASVTCNGRRRKLLTLWRFAKRKSPHCPKGEDLEAVEKLREPKRAPEAWTLPEMALILESCRLCRGKIAGVPAERWWEALVLTLYDTGLRRSAGMAICFEEIDFEAKMLRVPAERMKNAVEQYFRLSDQTIRAILASLPPNRKQVFPFPFTGHEALYGRLRVILRRAGLPFSKRDLFHKFRRTTASHLAQLAGKHSAIIQLGHQDQSCIDRYIDPRFTANHDGAMLLQRPSFIDQQPAAAANAPSEQPAPSAPPSPTSNQDVIEMLRCKPRLTGADLRRVLRALGVSAAQFAADLRTSVGWLYSVLDSREALSPTMDSRVRVALGLISPRRGRRDGAA